MEFRPFGTTGIEVSEVGFGAWAIGGDAWGPVEDADSLAAIERALELGVNFLDTADVYGDGRSESLVGRVLKGRREHVVVSTKGGLVGHHRDPQREPVYDRPEKVLVAFDASLRRLETDYIDVYWCHIWWHDARETAAFLDAFATLKRDGKVRAVGVSTDSMEHLRQFHQGTGGGGAGIDAVQLDYSILSRKAEAEMLPFAQRHGLAVVARGPLFKGLLTGKFDRHARFAEGDIRHGWPAEESYARNVERVERLRVLERDDRTLGQVALRFVLSHPGVSVAIPGAKNPAQVEANTAASVRPLLSEEERYLIDQVSR